MENRGKKLACMGAAFFLFGCRPFQPPPEQFEAYFKPGVDSKGVVEQMMKCGYPNARGFVGRNGRNVSLETEIRADQCMLRSGFRYRSGFRGLCSLTNETEHPECKE
jgi:hypothetical protein